MVPVIDSFNQTDLKALLCYGMCSVEFQIWLLTLLMLLWSLHWLPMRQRVTYKVALLTHKVRAIATLAYLSDLIQTTYRFGLCAHLMLHCWPSHGHIPNWLDALSLSQPHPSGTLYLPTFDCARAFP